MNGQADPDHVSSDSALIVDVQMACDKSDVPPARDIESWVARALIAAKREIPSQAEVSVRVVDTDEIQALNVDYRQQDKPTNVLSFPAGPVAGLPLDEASMLGDIVVCADVVSDEAAAQGKSAGDHWAHMLVHGTLHLVGYDHGDDVEAAEMEGLERKILQKYGLQDPYGESR